MTRIGIAQELVNSTAAAETHLDQTRTIEQIAHSLGAAHYLIADLAEGEPFTIVASNWSFDSIQVVGIEVLTKLLRQAEMPKPAAAAQFGTTLDGRELRALLHYGHAELVRVTLHAGTERFGAIFSARAVGCINTGLLPRARLLCSYLVSDLPSRRRRRAPADPLSDRERECLYWVAEGKTTDEVALILGVSSNTVNTYIAHAIQKLSATNRAMAIATAIRQGII